MENNHQKRNVDPQKISGEKLKGRFKLLGIITLFGAYISSGQMIPCVV